MSYTIGMEAIRPNDADKITELADEVEKLFAMMAKQRYLAVCSIEDRIGVALRRLETAQTGLDCHKLHKHLRELVRRHHNLLYEDYRFHMEVHCRMCMLLKLSSWTRHHLEIVRIAIARIPQSALVQEDPHDLPSV